MTDATLLPAIIEAIEKEAARRGKKARATYKAAMKELNDRHRTEQRRIEAQEKEALKAAERWRFSALAGVKPGAPVQISDIRSVKREVGEGADKTVVSLPRVKFLERQGGAR